MIFHIVIESDFHTHFNGDAYSPLSLAEEGFVHCAFKDSVVPVANDYFASASERLLVLEIEPEKLNTEVRYESPAPIAGGGSTHLESGRQFPHIYGPVNNNAIVGIGVLRKSPEGYKRPSTLVPLGNFFPSNPS